MSSLEPLQPSDVNDALTFASWAQSTYGAPHLTVQDIRILKRKAREFFAENPHATWDTLVQVAQWCASKKRRVSRVWKYIDQYRYAWADHAVDVTPRDDVQDQIHAAIAQEGDPAWRSRLRRAVGVHRQEVLDEWRNHHG